MRARLIVILGTILAVSVPITARAQWKELLQQLTHKTQSPSIANLSQGDMVAGLKEALAKGTSNAIRQLGRRDGFWGNAQVRIPLPGTLRKVADVARALGQGKKVDAFQLSLNRAAEKAVPQVADIFGDAIRHMTLDDARRILTGGDDAATQYFRRTAGPALAARIEPIVARATDRVGVTRHYKSFMASTGEGVLGGVLSRFGGKQASSSLNLDRYVTEQALNGLFATIASEEKAIRHDPAARTTALLKKVFGAH